MTYLLMAHAGWSLEPLQECAGAPPKTRRDFEVAYGAVFLLYCSERRGMSFLDARSVRSDKFSSARAFPRRA